MTQAEILAERAPRSQPHHEVAGTASLRRIERRKLIVSDPLQIRAALKKVLRRGQLSAMAGAQKSVGDLFRGGGRIPCATFLDPPAAFRAWEVMPPSDWRETHRPAKGM